MRHGAEERAVAEVDGGDQRRDRAERQRGVTPDRGTGRRRRALARGQRQPGQRGDGDDHGKGHVQEPEREEGRDRQRPGEPAPQRPPRDLVHGGDHQRDDDRLHAGEDGGDGRHLAVRRGDPGEHDHQRGARQHEGRAGDQPARDTMQPPAEPGGELLRLGPRQHHGEGEPAVEAGRRHPAAARDDLVLHQRDLRRRAAEGEQPDPAPDAHRLREARRRGASHSRA